jgi:hypothetical protein
MSQGNPRPAEPLAHSLQERFREFVATCMSAGQPRHEASGVAVLRAPQTDHHTTQPRTPEDVITVRYHFSRP